MWLPNPTSPMNKIRPRTCVLLLASSVLAAAQPRTSSVPPAADAEDANAPIVLNPFVVSTQEDRGYISTNSISATRIDTPVKDLPVQVSILNDAFLRDVDAATLGEALKFSASFDPEGGNRVRGMEALFDGNANRNGLGVNSRSTGSRSEPSVTADRLEVFKGPSSIINGAALPGGALNVVTKQPRGRTGGSAEVQTGSFELFRVKGEYNHVFTPNLALVGVVQYLDRGSDEWGRRHWNDEARTFYLAGRYRLSRRDELRFDYEFNEAVDKPLSTNFAWNWTTNLGGAQVPYYYQFNFPKDFHYDGPDRKRTNTRRLYNATWTRFWTDSLVTNLLFNHQYRDEENFESPVDIVNNNPDTPVDPDLGRKPYEARRRWQDSLREDRFYKYTLQALYSREIGRTKNRLFAEYSFWNYYYDFNRRSHRAPGTQFQDAYEYFPLEEYADQPDAWHALNLRAPSSFNWVYNAGSSNSTRVDERQVSVRYQGEYDTPAGLIHVLAGVNRGWHDRLQKGHERVPGTPTSGENQVFRANQASDERSSDLLPSVGLVYQPNDTWSFYAAGNQSYTFQFRRNSFLELLPNTSGESFEIGTKIEVLEGRVVGQVGYFDTVFADRPLEFRNYPVRDAVLLDGTVITVPADQQKWDPVTNPIVSGAGSEWFATGEFSSKGIDAELVITPVPHWQTAFSYLYADAEVTADANPVVIGRRESGNAQHTAAVFTNYSFTGGPLKGLQIGGGYRWSSARVDTYLVLDGRSVLIERDGYRALTAFARYRREIGGRDWSLQVNANNLLREDFVTGIVPGTQNTANLKRYAFQRPVEWRLSLGLSF